MGFRQALDPATLGKYASAGTFTKAQAITPDTDAVALALNGGGPSATTPRLTLGDTGVGHGPFAWSLGGATFSGTYDPVAALGYNTGTSGGSVAAALAGEPYFGLVFEGDYNDGVRRNMEGYLEAKLASGASLRPLFFQIDRGAASQGAMITSAAILGNPFNVNHPDGTNVANFQKSLAVVAGVAGSDTTLRVQAPASRAAQLTLGAQGTDDVLKFVTSGSSLNSAFIQLNAQANPLRLFAAPGGSAGSALAIGANEDSAIGLFAVGASLATRKGIVARGRASQSGNLFEVQDSSSNPLSTFSENGYFTTLKTAAPADAELAASEMALWFDATNGAAKLMVKAKQADGTVRTGSLALA